MASNDPQNLTDLALRKARPKSMNENNGGRGRPGSLPDSSILAEDGFDHDSPRWRNKKGKASGVVSGLNSAKAKLRDRRKQREKKRSPGTGYFPQSTEGTSSGDDGDFSKAGPETTIVQQEKLQQHQTSNHPPVTRRISPGLMAARFRGSKSQSDLDADCEDNTADYDSASIISASDAGAALNSQFFVPRQPHDDADRNFQAHVQEIRVAGMQQLSVSGGGEGTGEEEQSSSSDDGLDEDLAKILENERRDKSSLLVKLSQQEERITELQRMVTDLTKKIQETDAENRELKAMNQALLDAVHKKR